MYLTKEQLQELQDTGIDEKIDKFAELFPNGTEVTRELCMTHQDVFSFGCPVLARGQRAHSTAATIIMMS